MSLYYKVVKLGIAFEVVFEVPSSYLVIYCALYHMPRWLSSSNSHLGP